MKRLGRSAGIILVALIGYGVNHFLDGKPQARSGEAGVSIEQPLQYTKHARCRMDCRKIDQTEVEDVVTSGKVNPRKSNANSRPCPTQAKEKRTRDGQKVRVILGHCRNVSKVITVIDLENEYKCRC